MITPEKVYDNCKLIEDKIEQLTIIALSPTTNDEKCRQLRIRLSQLKEVLALFNGDINTLN